MAVIPPQVHTYHCICTSLLLASTHKLSTLPRRAAPSLDEAYILPVPSQPPSFSSSWSPTPDPQSDASKPDQEQDTPMQDITPQAMPAEGYTLLLGLSQDPKTAIIRKEDGFEKRTLWRCERCAVVVGYEILSSEGKALEKGVEEWEGRLVYLLPNGLLGTDTMVKGAKIGEVDVEMGSGKGVGVWE